MSWLKYAMISDAGTAISLRETDLKLKKMRKFSRRRRAAQYNRDEAQDDRIKALELENDEIKLLVIELMSLLTQKQVMSEKESADLIERVGELVPDDPPEDDPLADLADAVSDY